MYNVPQALAKDLPWKLKESRVAEILEAVVTVFFYIAIASLGISERERQFYSLSRCIFGGHRLIATLMG